MDPLTTISSCSAQHVEAVAKALAMVEGHQDIDHLIVCSDGSEVPVWRFFVAGAGLLLGDLLAAGFVVTKIGSSDVAAVLESLLAFPSDHQARAKACDLLAALKANEPEVLNEPARRAQNARDAGR